MIRFFHVTKVHASGRKVLEDVSLFIPKGSFLVITGEGRTGKSTFLKLICGEEAPTQGKVLVGDVEPSKISEEKREVFLQRLGLFFPDLGLLPDRTVWENLLIRTPVEKLTEAGRSAQNYLEMFALARRKNDFPADLSMVEQRLVAFIRAFLLQPECFLADEPFQGLDEKNATIVWELLARFHGEGKTVILATGDGEAFLRHRAENAPIVFLRLEQGKSFLEEKPST